MLIVLWRADLLPSNRGVAEQAISQLLNMFYDNRVDNLKKNRDYSSLLEAKPAQAADSESEEDGERPRKAGHGSQEKRPGKEWGGFFGSKPQRSAAEKLAELRARAEQEQLQKDLEKMRAERIAASKKASVSGASKKSNGLVGSASKQNEVRQKVQKLEKHARAQMLKQARDFSDLLGAGTSGSREKSQTPETQKLGAAPKKLETNRKPELTKSKAAQGGQAPARDKDYQTLMKHRANLKDSLKNSRENLKEMQRRSESVPAVQPRANSAKKLAEQKQPRKEASSNGGSAISSLATITPEGALVANRGLSLDQAKRLKKGAKLLGMKLYFEVDEKERLKDEKMGLERQLTDAFAGKETKVKANGSTSGAVPRSLDEERRRAGNGNVAPARAKPQANGNVPHKQARPAGAPSQGARDRAAPKGNAFSPYKGRPGQLKRKHPDEEDSDSFLDEGEEEEEEGPSREAVSSLIRKMFRYDPHKYVRDDRDDPMMEVGFKRMQAEEQRSARIAREEDEREAERLELEERRREEKRRKKAGGSNKFIAD